MLRHLLDRATSLGQRVTYNLESTYINPTLNIRLQLKSAQTERVNQLSIEFKEFIALHGLSLGQTPKSVAERFSTNRSDFSHQISL